MRRLDLTVLFTLVIIFVGVNILVAAEFLKIIDMKNGVLTETREDEIKKVIQITQSTPKQGVMREYFVKQGDSLSGISRKFLGSGVEWEVIAEANNIHSPDEIQTGMHLLIPLKFGRGFYQKGTASWYGKLFHGRETASGNNYDMYAYTAAHRSLPLGSKVRVVNLQNGKDIIVRINDRGPYIKNRIIDLSYSAAKSLGMVDWGIQDVKIEVISIPNV